MSTEQQLAAMLARLDQMVADAEHNHRQNEAELIHALREQAEHVLGLLAFAHDEIE